MISTDNQSAIIFCCIDDDWWVLVKYDDMPQLDSKHFLHVKEKKCKYHMNLTAYLPTLFFKAKCPLFSKMHLSWWDLKVNYCQIISFLFVLKHQPLTTLTWPLHIKRVRLFQTLEWFRMPNVNWNMMSSIIYVKCHTFWPLF